MNDHPKNLTNYDTFFSDLLDRFEDLSAVANAKIAEEHSAWGALPSWFSDKGDYSDTGVPEFEQAVTDFCREQCSGDYEELEAAVTDIEHSRTVLNGDGVADGEFDGIGPTHNKIVTGLSTWRNSTGDVFRTKYVDSIQTKKAEQIAYLRKSQEIVRAAQMMMVETRRSVRKLVDDAITALNSYNPWWGNLDVALTGLGITTGYVGSTLVVIVQSQLDADKASSVKGLLSTMVGAVNQLAEQKHSGEKAVAKSIRDEVDQATSNFPAPWAMPSQRTNERRYWNELVLSRPYESRKPPGPPGVPY